MNNISQQAGFRATIVVPCYNEASRFPHADFARFLKESSKRENGSIAVLFVNDGSTDETLKLLTDFTKDHSNASVLDMPENRGKAEAVRAGMTQALKVDATIVGYLDADLATTIEEAAEMVDYLANSPYLAIFGSRINRLGSDIRRNMLRHYFGRVFATFTSIILKLAIYDTQCGAKFFKRSEQFEDALQAPFISRWVFDVELIKRLQRHGWEKQNMYEWPLRRWHDIAGSKVRIIDVVRALMDLVKIASL